MFKFYLDIIRISFGPYSNLFVLKIYICIFVYSCLNTTRFFLVLLLYWAYPWGLFVKAHLGRPITQIKAGAQLPFFCTPNLAPSFPMQTCPALTYTQATDLTLSVSPAMQHDQRATRFLSLCPLYVAAHHVQSHMLQIWL